MLKNIIVLGDNEAVFSVLTRNLYNVEYVSELSKEINSAYDMLIIGDENFLNNFTQINIPTLFFSNSHENAGVVKDRLKIEFFDFISDSFHEYELIDKIEKLLQLKKINDEFKEVEKKNDHLVRMLREVNNINRKLMIKTQSLEEESSMDPLSNVYNRKYTLKRLDEEIGRAFRYERKFAIALIDIINISEINKSYGHIAGDETIAKVSRIIEDSVRTSDIIGRIRGDTFLVILPEIIEQYSAKVIDRIVENIEQTRIKEIKLEVYTGFAIIDRAELEKFQNSRDLLVLLDKLIIFAKQSGKRIVEYNEEAKDNVNKIKEYVMKNEIEDKHNIILEELSKSKKFIERMLPKKEEWEERLKYSYIYYPFNFIGGDFFDFMEIGKGKIAVLFCDVSGHGVSAALYITAIKYIFRNVVHQYGEGIDPAEFMNIFNKSILELAEQNIFVATTFGIFDKENLSFKYSYGGGTVPLKINKEAGTFEPLAEGGFIVGLFEEAEFTTREVLFKPDDLLLFYSDGIYEFLIENGIMKDEKGFFEVVKKSIEKNNSADFVHSLYLLIQEKITDDADFNDDITVLALQA